MKAACAGIERWVLRLKEYDLKVYWPVKTNIADYPSALNSVKIWTVVRRTILSDSL